MADYSESVSEGHSDRFVDRISDQILDAFLERDPQPAFVRLALAIGIAELLRNKPSEPSPIPGGDFVEELSYEFDLVVRHLFPSSCGVPNQKMSPQTKLFINDTGMCAWRPSEADFGKPPRSARN